MYDDTQIRIPEEELKDVQRSFDEMPSGQQSRCLKWVPVELQLVQEDCQTCFSQSSQPCIL